MYQCFLFIGEYKGLQRRTVGRLLYAEVLASLGAASAVQL